MAHLRKRYLKENLEKVLKFSPLVGVLGHRQVGKTTLAEQLGKEYFTLDDSATRLQIAEDAKAFLSHQTSIPTVIDECQYEPSLFPALKERVRKDKRPGQFLLSGSVRFTSKKAIQESLTGRIINLELLPLSLSEIKHLEKPTIVHDFVQARDLDSFLRNAESHIRKTAKLDSEVDEYLVKGGLPGICFVRNVQLRKTRISEQLSTVLDRDLRLVQSTSLPYSQILDFARILSVNEGQPLVYSNLREKSGISEVTQKKLLYALEAIFLIRLIPFKSGIKGFTLYFEDQAEALHLDSSKPMKQQLEGLLFRSIRVQQNYTLGDTSHYFSYSTRGGARIPFALENDGGIVGFRMIEGQDPEQSDFASANSFLKTFNNSKIIFTGRKCAPKVLNPRSLVLPLHSLL